MTPESLRLMGFAGIRAGLGCDDLVLDLARLAGEAQLVAITGPNGAGKSTVMDNLQPFRLLASRASSFSPAGFSFYEHLVLPECLKELTWRHEGARYRSSLVFRLNGRRKTEAYLHVEEGRQWRPFRSADGTVSDGRAETYDACVEALLGSPETFFTSVFAAQGRRPLSSCTAGEVKDLMVELLGLESIRRAGEKAAQVARALRTTLEERRRTASGCGDVEQRISLVEEARARCADDLVQVTQRKALAYAVVERAHATVVQLAAERRAAQATEDRRAGATQRLAAARQALAQVQTSFHQDREREQRRLAARSAELGAAETHAGRRRHAVATRRDEAQAVLAQKDTIAGAVERAKTMEDAERRLREALEAAQARHHAGEAHRRDLAVLRSEAEGLRREAGEAALRAASLRQRLGLIDTVPCRATDLQSRCELLVDARHARALVPSADDAVARIGRRLEAIGEETRRHVAAIAQLRDTADGVRRAQAELKTLTEVRRRTEALAALGASLQQAEQRLSECAAASAEIDVSLQAAKDRFARERDEVAANVVAIEQRCQQHTETAQAAIRAIEGELAGMPPPFDAAQFVAAETTLEAARAQLAMEEAAYLTATKQEVSLQAELVELRTRASVAVTLRAESLRVEGELGWWNLLAKALGNDGVVALCIDDAGPELARLTNQLLLACYGPRFTVSIRTQVTTVKKELREGFDIVVFDADTGQAKSVAVMSGGERIWINEALTRALALYLAHTSGRRYETLFSDEADGALDSERKRMFLHMKREVLRLGGYAREYLVSQTPELTHMADVVIDVGALATAKEARIASGDLTAQVAAASSECRSA